jgi:tripartite-type tricarboxylate transporter receptor subunit TctC
MGRSSRISSWFSLLLTVPNRVARFAANTHQPRREFILSFAVLAALFATGGLAEQSYPKRPIRLVVPTAPGDLSDLAARSLAYEIGVQMGQQVVVENRPGASGIIALETIARATPDGYTVGYVTNVLATNPSLYSKLPYDSVRDFQAVALNGSNANLLAVTPVLPIQTVKELIEYARANPAKLSFGGIGIGTGAHLSMELFKIMTGSNIVHVSYKGIQQAISDVIGGQIHIVCAGAGAILPHVNAGRVRALGVTSLKRLLAAPNVPTLDEAGVPGYEVTGWGGYVVPAKTPRNIVLRLNTEINKALLSPSVLKGFAVRGSTPGGGTPEQFAEYIRAEKEKWGKVIKTAGIKPQ